MLLFSPELFNSSGKYLFLHLPCHKSSPFSKHARGNCSSVEMRFKEEEWLICAFEDQTSRKCRCKCRKFWNTRGSGKSSDEKFRRRHSEKGLEKKIIFNSSVRKNQHLRCTWGFCFGRSQRRHIVPQVSMGYIYLLFSNCIYMDLCKGQAYFSPSVLLRTVLQSLLKPPSLASIYAS